MSASIPSTHRAHYPYRRLVALVGAAALLCVAIVASPATAATPAASMPGAGSAAGKTFVYVGGQTGDPIYGTVYCGAKAEARRLGAVAKYQTVGTDFTGAAQIPVLNGAAASRPAGIMISPTDPNGLFAPIKSVVARGIPVVTTDNTLANPAGAGVTAQVLVDNRASGVLAAQFLAQRAHGRKVKVAVMSFTLGGSRAADDEWHGFEDTIKKYPNITYLGPEFNAGGVGETARTASGIMTHDPDIFGLFATEGDAANGMVVAARQHGLHPLIVGAYTATLDSLVGDLRTGVVAAIVDFPFERVGAASIDQLANKVAGRPVDKAPNFSAVIYTKADLSRPGVALGSKRAVC